MNNKVPNSNLIVENEKEAPVFYVNTTKIVLSSSDFNILLGFQKNIDGQLYIETLARVVMSPEYAKFFLRSFEESIKKYEEKFGEIKLSS